MKPIAVESGSNAQSASRRVSSAASPPAYSVSRPAITALAHEAGDLQHVERRGNQERLVPKVAHQLPLPEQDEVASKHGHQRGLGRFSAGCADGSLYVLAFLDAMGRYDPGGAHVTFRKIL